MRGPVVTRRATLAYAHARLRACKSRLLTRSDAAPLWTAADAKAMHRVVEALGAGEPWRRALQVYAAAIRTGRQPLFDALLRRHEIENVKLLWRVAIMHRPRAVIRHLWIDLGAFASFPSLDGGTPDALAAQLAGTPYAGIATTVARAHGNDLAAAELAFDRWVTQCLLAEARTLSRREVMTRRLVELVVREREAQLELRGAKWYGLESITPRGNADDECGAAFLELIPHLAALAQEEIALARLSAAMRQATKLLNALQKVVLPRIEHDIHAIVDGLEEDERDDAIRRRAHIAV